MKKINLVLLLTFAAFCLNACRGGGDDILPDNNPHTSEGNILDKYIVFDTTEAAGLDTLVATQFYYDGQNRITRITDRTFARGSSVVAFHSEELRSYNGSETVPFRVTRRNENTPLLVYIDTTFLSYNSDKMISRDSIVRYINTTKRDMYCFYYNKTGPFTYDVFGQAYDYQANMPIHANKILLTKNMVNGNFVKTYDSIYAQEIPGRWDVTKVDYVYDNHPNPFVKTALAYPDLRYDIFEGNFTLYTTNNILSYTRNSYSNGSPLQTTQSDRSYTYNGQGYPITIRQTPGDPRVKTLVYYKF